MPDPVLTLEGITKRFGALVANEDVSLALHPGEVTALLGENGAGKTTLMNILFGHYVADAGVVRVRDRDGVLRPLPPGEPKAALDAGIGMVHQHFALAENLTGFENVVLGTEPMTRWFLDAKAPRRRLDALIRETGLAVDLDRRVEALSVGERQRVEILKALYRNARVLVLDEPTAVLTPQQAESLFAAVRALAAKGLAVVFISHKMHEVLSLADRIVVLRLGRKVADRDAKGVDAGLLAELMVGRRVEAPPRKAGKAGDTVVAQLDRITTATGRDRLVEASLTLRAGEIVGIAGVSGNGQSALAGLLAGTIAPAAGTLTMLGEAVGRVDPGGMVARGVGRIPEDRHREGVVGAMSVAENLALEHLRARKTQRLGFLRRRAMAAAAVAAIKAYDVRCPGPEAPIRLLSGGNMQKVILARVFEARPQLVLAHQPTRGLDVAATAEVQRRLLAAKEEGAAVVLISEDLDELTAIADRIAVLHRGHLTPAYRAEALDHRAIGLMMAGEAVEVAA